MAKTIVDPDEFDARFELYKKQFGSTFSYFLVKRSSDKVHAIAYNLMLNALVGKSPPITDKMLGIEIPPDTIS